MTIKNQQIELGDICLDVVQKDIKNMYLTIHPPTGRARISAPLRMDLDTIRVFAISKLSWIRKHQEKFRNQPREAPREYITGESHYYLGRRYLLRVIEHNAPPKVALKHETMEIYIRPNTGVEKRGKILDEWYRQRLKEIIPGIIAKYEKIMKVKVDEFGIRKMKTKWGSCNIKARRIWLNLELAKKGRYYIEYIIVHEMVHLLERRHNDRFMTYMDRFIPQWRFLKEELNRSMLPHANWGVLSLPK